YLPT
uniref:[des-Arg1]-proctolin n=1 Tax=Tityus serrulatus TaxID=6887 RepID=PRCT_TITSE